MRIYFIYIAKISLKYLIKYTIKNNIIFGHEVMNIYMAILNLFSQNQYSLCEIFPY